MSRCKRGKSEEVTSDPNQEATCNPEQKSQATPLVHRTVRSPESAARAVRDWLFSNTGPQAGRCRGVLIDDDTDVDEDDDEFNDDSIILMLVMMTMMMISMTKRIMRMMTGPPPGHRTDHRRHPDRATGKQDVTKPSTATNRTEGRHDHHRRPIGPPTATVLTESPGHDVDDDAVRPDNRPDLYSHRPDHTGPSTRTANQTTNQVTTLDDRPHRRFHHQTTTTMMAI